jgi:hypothetical protein
MVVLRSCCRAWVVGGFVAVPDVRFPVSGSATSVDPELLSGWVIPTTARAPDATDMAAWVGREDRTLAGPGKPG